jgi:hypothetical protein
MILTEITMETLIMTVPVRLKRHHPQEEEEGSREMMLV